MVFLLCSDKIIVIDIKITDDIICIQCPMSMKILLKNLIKEDVH